MQTHRPIPSSKSIFLKPNFYRLIPSICRWRFNSSTHFATLPPEKFFTDRSMSVASYTPKSEIDYGTLSCWASNEVGDQKRPCIFHVIPAGNAKKMERRFEIIKSTTATFPSLKGRQELRVTSKVMCTFMLSAWVLVLHLVETLSS